MKRYDEYDDMTLFMLLKVHDEQAFSELYNRFSIVLLRYALRSMKNASDAEDVVHDVFMYIWERRNKIQIHTSVSAFLYRSLLNMILNRIKRIRLYDQYVNELAKLSEFQENTAIARIDEKELIARFESGLEKLPPRMRAAFEYSRFDHMTYEEIGKKMGVSINTVKSHIRSALKVIRKGTYRWLFSLF